MAGELARERVALAGAYGLYFCAVGVVMPFLPAHFAALGVSPARIGVLLSLAPALSLVAPARWGRWADRRARPDLALRAATLGAALCFATLVPARTFGQALLAMAGYAVFSTSITPLLDGLTVECVRRGGGSFGRVRLVGSLAFAASAALFGRFGGPGRAVVLAPLAALSALAAWAAFALPPPPAAPALDRPAPRSWRGPLPPGLAPFLGTCLLHWMALAPFHGNFALHVAALGLPREVTGWCSSLGVLAEVAVMAGSATLLRRWGAAAVLRLSFAAGALRWGLMAVVRSAPALLAVSLLHGLTFGAFYVAAVAFLSARVPPERRASGQALFAAVTFGVGGIAGYALSGAAFQAIGGPALFAVAALVELAALALSAALGGRRPAGALVSRGPRAALFLGNGRAAGGALFLVTVGPRAALFSC